MPFLAPEPVEPVPTGELDTPPPGTLVQRGPINLGGWVHFPSGPVARVDLRLDERPLGKARLGLARADVCDRCGIPLGAAMGFEVFANLLDWPEASTEAVLQATATAVSGERLELAPRQIEVAPASTSPRPSAAPARGPRPSRGNGLRTLVFTHQLDLGGAQLYLLELLGELLGIGSVNPAVVSARDGALRPQLEALGIPVHISGLPPSDGLSSHLGRIEELARWTEDGDFEVVFVNTATELAFSGIEVAAALGIPTLWAIHESLPPAALWAGMHQEVRPRAERALGEVEKLLFVADATRFLFEPLAGPDRCLTIPYGLDFEPIESRRDDFDWALARRTAGIPNSAEVLLCVGTIEPRKGQVPLLQAFELIAAEHPDAHLVFLGARDEPSSRFLADYASASSVASRVSVVPMTPDPHPWFGLADLLVCASDVESLPRTVIEAMAWETPVLATDVFGLPELIDDGETGWLCEPRDLGALRDGLERALNSGAEERRRIGLAARTLVEQRHSLGGYGREITALLNQVASGDRGEPLIDAAAG
jgi:glycosyltransferase involved in cell wall biosynthesis